MENFRHFIVEEKIDTYIKNTDSLTEKQLKEFIIKEYAKKNIVLSEQQLNEIMPKWLKVLGAKAAMLGTVGSLAMGTAAQAGVISDIPVTAADGSEASYTLTADEVQSLADAINEIPDESPENAESGTEEIKKHAQGLEKVADHPSADISYDDLSAGELMQALEIWAQKAYDSKNAPESGEESGGEQTELEKLGQAAAGGDQTALSRLQIMAQQSSGARRKHILKILNNLN